MQRYLVTDDKLSPYHISGRNTYLVQRATTERSRKVPRAYLLGFPSPLLRLLLRDLDLLLRFAAGLDERAASEVIKVLSREKKMKGK
jgi:hypothetical protein